MSEAVSVSDVVSSGCKTRSLSRDYADNVHNGTITVAKTQGLSRELQTLQANLTSLGSAELDSYCYKMLHSRNIADIFESLSLAAEESIRTKDVDQGHQDLFISDAAKLVRLIGHYQHGLERALPEGTRPSEAHAGAEALAPDWSFF